MFIFNCCLNHILISSFLFNLLLLSLDYCWCVDINTGKPIWKTSAKGDKAATDCETLARKVNRRRRPRRDKKKCTKAYQCLPKRNAENPISIGLVRKNSKVK